jgi:hypothetical protein
MPEEFWLVTWHVEAGLEYTNTMRPVKGSLATEVLRVKARNATIPRAKASIIFAVRITESEYKMLSED